MRMRKLGFVLIGLFIIFTSETSASDETQYNHVFTIESPFPENHGWFGYQVELSNGIIAIGAPYANTEYEEAGKIFLYDLEGKLVATIESPTSQYNDQFGYNLDLSDNRLISGELSDVESLRLAGRAHIFADTGELLFSKTSPVLKAGAYFGHNGVAINNEIILIQDYNAKTTPGMAGLVHIYDGEGNYLGNLTSPNPILGGRFGKKIKLSDEIILIAEYGTQYDNRPMGPGSVYAFNYSLNHLFTMQAPETEVSACFGASISVSDEYIVIGESWATVDNETKAGRAYIYDVNGEYLHTLESPNPKTSGEFGDSVSISGNIIVIGEWDADVNPDQYEGRAYVYDTEGNLLQNLTSPEPCPRAAFGLDLDIDGDYIVVGESWAASGELGQVGRVHVFKLGAPVESQESVEETTTETEEPESETDTGGGIPGFPVLAILSALVICYFRRKWMV